MDSLTQYIRANRTVPVVHSEAFQCMLYTADGAPDLWIWNSRDGVTPFGFTIDGHSYRHAMNAYCPTYSAVLPDEAEHVWVDYDRQTWADMQRDKWQYFANRPASDPYGGSGFATEYPTPEDWLAITPFEHGQPLRLSRSEYLAWTPGYAGQYAEQVRP